MHSITTNKRLIAAVALAAGAWPAVIHAQGAALEEVVVTAQKREEFLQKTPISLVALDAGSLEERGLADLRDLQRNVPNLQMSQQVTSAASVRIFIRGVGNFDDQITQDPSVAVYMDGVYVARSQGLLNEVADIERIEVLRGPQGTLYGRNATGGAINFVTRAPVLGDWNFSQTFTFGNRNEFRSKTMVNAPLGDTLAARLSYVKAERDGFVKNRGTGADTFGEQDRAAWRADLYWQAAPTFDVRYTYDHSQIDDTSGYLVRSPINGDVPRPSSGNPAVQNFRPNDVTTAGHHLIANWELSDTLTLRSITAYRTLDNFDYQDYLSGQHPLLPVPLRTRNEIEQKQWSQELQVIGDTWNDQIEYVAGLYFFRETGDGGIYTEVPSSNITTLGDTDITNSARALFGQATYTPDWLDALHITLGLRWSKDEREAELANSTILASGAVVPGTAGRGDRDFSNSSPSLTIAYDITDNASIYAKAAKGYKTGGFNVRASTIARFEEGFGEETLLSREIGGKTQWWDNRLRINGALFKATYDDIQINAQSNPSNPAQSDVINAGEATIQGAELEVTALLVERLTVSVNYGYLDTDYDSIINALGQDVRKAYVFVNAPEHSYMVNVDYDIAETPVGKVSANVNYSWQDEKYATASTAVARLKIDGYGLLNARLTLAEIPGLPAGDLRVAVWGKNLEDEDYSVLHAPLFGGYRMFGEPRSYGVDVTYEF